MGNEHVHPFFAGLLADLAGEKKHLQSQTVYRRDTTRFRILQQVQAECEEAGLLIDPGQIEWIVRTVEQRLREADLEKQYEYERSRDTRQARNDEAVEAEQIEKRERDAQRAR